MVSTTFVNGSFESSYTGWTQSGNQSIKNSTAPDLASNGTRYVSFNSGNSTPNGQLSQAFSTTPGASYVLSFDVGILAYVNKQQVLRIAVDGTTNLVNRTITVLGNASGVVRWTPQNFSFVADSVSTTLTFRDQSTTTNSIDLLLDNVRIGTAATAAALLPTEASPLMEESSNIASEPYLPDQLSLSGAPGDFRIHMNASQSGNYVLERSEDLKTWERVGEMQLMEPGPIEFRDKAESAIPQTPSVRLFYRIGLIPKGDTR